MTAIIAPPFGAVEARIARVVASTLRVSVESVERDVPFTMLGMDSLGAVELTVAIGDELGVELPMTAVLDYCDVATLAQFIECGAGSLTRLPVIERMRADAVLPSEIVPKGSVRLTRDATEVLLTGSTGFVGAFALRAMLDSSAVFVNCLVRGRDGERRLRRNLARYGLSTEHVDNRVRVLAGDVTLPGLGLCRSDYDSLVGRVGAIYHGAAAVDWVQAYDSLRAANVLGTIEILRFACHGAAIPVHFLSSLGVCYSTTAAAAADERTDVFANADGLLLGYAQSKAVAEELVRQAGARGLPVTIMRPALVSGDSVTGVSNTDDLLARFIGGCIAMGAAPNLDWRVDCVPVDHVARAILSTAARHEQGVAVAHFANTHARHWRECVLWMRLQGYEIELLPYREWIQKLKTDTSARNPLHGLKSFFLREFSEERRLTIPELYEESRRVRADGVRTDADLLEAGIRCPSVDAPMLGRYFEEYEKQRLIPSAPAGVGHLRASTLSVPDMSSVIPDIQEALRVQRSDASIKVVRLSLEPLGGDDSIIGELTAWRHGVACGLFRCSAELRTANGPETLPLFVKAKPSDEHVLDVAQCVASLAEPELAEAYARFRNDVGFTRSHLRELALYAHADERLRRHSPRPLVIERDDSARRWLLVLESIDDVRERPVGDKDVASARWSDADIDTALRGMAEIHSVWCDRTPSEMEAAWLPAPRPARRMEEMRPLWRALAAHAAAHSGIWREGDIAEVHARLVEHMDWAWELDKQPQTLIHNDFNPRNVAIRQTNGARRLCAYDWELARMGIPQRDLAEFLCFVLPATVSKATVERWLDRSRTLLEAQTGRSIEAQRWERGFRAALCDFLVDRLAMYAMVSRFRQQRFLPSVLRTWRTLCYHYPWIVPA